MIIWRRTFRGREYPTDEVIEAMRQDVLAVFGHPFILDEMPCRGSITLYEDAYHQGLSKVEIRKFVIDSYRRHMTRAGLPCGRRTKRSSTVVPFRWIG